MARRSKATEARIEALLSALRAGTTRDAAAMHAEIDRTTLWRWIRGDAALRARVEKAEADAEVRMTAQIVQSAALDWRAAAHWLERRRPATWGRHQAASAAAGEPVPSDGSATTSIPHPLDDLAPDEVRRRAREWAERLAADDAEGADDDHELPSSGAAGGAG